MPATIRENTCTAVGTPCVALAGIHGDLQGFVRGIAGIHGDSDSVPMVRVWYVPTPVLILGIIPLNLRALPLREYARGVLGLR